MADNNTPLCYMYACANRKVTLCNYNYSKEGIYHPDRIMDEYDMLYLTSGNWNIYEDDNLYNVSAGQILLLEPGKHHYSLTKCSPEMRNVFLHLEKLRGDGIKTESSLLIPKLSDCSADPDIYNIFEQIIELFWSEKADLKEFRINALLNRLLLKLNDISAKISASSDPVISDAIFRFRSNPDIFFSPETLAGDYGLSLRTMSSKFKKATGTSIHQYQLNQKLDMAYDALMQNPARSIKDIAISYGFYDEFHFSKLFKRKFNVSPSTVSKKKYI